MLTTKTKKSLRTTYDAYSNSHEGFIQRKAQMNMMAVVAGVVDRTYDGENRPDGFDTPIAIIEGPTGTGKTLGYLLGSLPAALATGKKIVISTATIALQEQLFNKDIPQVKTHSGLDFKFVLAKGRRRYCCIQRLSTVASESGGGLFGDPQYNNKDKALYAELDTAFNAKSWDGDGDSWAGTIPYPMWDKISTDAAGCTNRKCSKYHECPFFKARNALSEADVVVANHDLVLASLKSESMILPDPQKTLYIADEAHHLPDTAINHNGASHTIDGSIEWLNQGANMIKTLTSFLPNTSPADFSVDDNVASLTQSLLDFKGSISGVPSLQPDDSKKYNNPLWRFQHGIIPDSLRTLATKNKTNANTLHQKLSRLLEHINSLVEKNSISDKDLEQVIPELSVYIGRVENVLTTWMLFCQSDPDGEPPLARWVELKKKGDHYDYLISVNAITADKLLNKLVWNQFAGVILTSATLSSVGTFQRFAEKCGLQYQKDTHYLKLASPFDFANNAEIDIPKMKSLPSDEGHTEEITQWMNSEIDPAKGVLVLFSSYWQMNKVKENLKPKLKKQLLVQGDMSKQSLLNAHREAIDANNGSILFGVASLSEGVDLPGRYLEHIIIAKLPFTAPDTPILNALSEWIEKQGQNPFMLLSVPDASTKLIQGVGRLIRTETDKGRVTILDSRLLTKRYGKQMLNDLPPMKRLFS